MRQLTKGMYADLNCKEFGLSYGQHRTNDVLRSAGWFNDLGEKLGYGDLSLSDLDAICNDLRDGEYFIALSEANTIWDMPVHLEKINPGIEYVMEHAAWLCTNADLYKICLPTGGQDKHYHLKGNYYEIKREYLFEELKFHGGKFNSKVGVLITEVISHNFYGLDEYRLSNGQCWAVGHKEDIVRGAKAKANDSLYKFGAGHLIQVLPMSQKEVDHIQYVINSLGPDSEYILDRLLGEEKIKYLDYLAKYHQYDIFGTDVLLSDEIPGLPVGYRAILIRC